MVTEAKDAEKGKKYVATKNRRLGPTYYEVPSLSRAAYLKRLQKKYRKHSLLCGQESSNLSRLTKDPAAVLLRFVRRYRTPESTRYAEVTSLHVVNASLRLREVKTKPTYRTRKT